MLSILDQVFFVTSKPASHYRYHEVTLKVGGLLVTQSWGSLGSTILYNFQKC